MDQLNVHKGQCIYIKKKIKVFNYGFDYVSLHFEVENITSNCKMFFSTQNAVLYYLPKYLTMLSQAYNTIETYLHVSTFQPTSR
jgi:hypothetical protein